MKRIRRHETAQPGDGLLICSHCGGTGAFEVSNRDYGATTSWVDCENCGGYGTVEAPVSEEPAKESA